MSVKPSKAPAKDAKDAKDDKSDAKPGKEDGGKPEKEAFVNEPSSLDDATHRELELMHSEAAEAILFAKNIQWRSVG